MYSEFVPIVYWCSGEYTYVLSFSGVFFPSLANNDDWSVCVLDHVIADASHNIFLEFAPVPGSHDYRETPLFPGGVYDGLAVSLAGDRKNSPFDLKRP